MATQTHCLVCRNSLRGGASQEAEVFGAPANDRHECNPPTLATTTLPQIHRHPSTAPHSQNSREPSILEIEQHKTHGQTPVQNS